MITILRTELSRSPEYAPSTTVMSVVIFDLKEEGQFGAIAVLGLVMLVMTFATVTLVQRVLGRDFLGTRE